MGETTKESVQVPTTLLDTLQVTTEQEMQETESVAQSDTIIMRDAILGVTEDPVTEPEHAGVPVPGVDVPVTQEPLASEQPSEPVLSVGQAVSVEPVVEDDPTKQPGFAVRNLESELLAEPVTGPQTAGVIGTR